MAGKKEANHSNDKVNVQIMSHLNVWRFEICELHHLQMDGICFKKGGVSNEIIFSTRTWSLVDVDHAISNRKFSIPMDVR